MTNQILKTIIVFLYFFLASKAVLVKAQNTDNLQQIFEQYQQHSIQEKLFVHTSKNTFLTGEIIWFKIYCVDESFNRLLSVSRVCYVEIINADKKPVLQASIDMKDGTGNGSFIIPSSLVSGNYILRAYTSRMKNFSADFYYMQQLSVINTLKEPLIKITPSSKQYSLQIFPEGGNLVYGINSKIAFKISDQYGNGIDATGFIQNQFKDTLAKIQTHRYGMGNFMLLPQKDNIYSAVFKINDTTIIQNLPSIFTEGFVMALTQPDKNQLKVAVAASGQYLNTPIFLLVHTRHTLKKIQAKQLINGNVSFSIDKDLLGDGISHLTIFNSDRQPVCERLYFKKPEHTLQILSQLNQPNYSPRNKISIDLLTNNQLGNTVSADMSVSVFMVDSIQPVGNENITAYLMLQSELTGRIDSPEYYFENNSLECREAIDNLMLTQGWRRFKWENVLANTKPVFEFITEMEGPVISGRVSDKNTGLPKPGVTVSLTAPGEVFDFRTSLSKQNGAIHFNTCKFYGTNELVVQTNNLLDSTTKIDIQNPYSENYSLSKISPLLLPEKWKDLLLYHSINAQVENAYLVDKKIHSYVFQPDDTLAFYGTPEHQYFLDDYTRFNTMEEVMQEFVADVRVKKLGDNYGFKVLNTQYKNFFELNPLVLIDGVPVNDVSKIMSFDPLKIKKIDVVTHKNYQGSFISEGIVSYKTYQGDLGGYQLDPNAVVIEYEGLQRQREFFSPVYETKLQAENRIPDTRNLLFWSPELKTGKNGKTQIQFYTSDLSANYTVVIQGVTNDGLSGTSVFYFTVK